MSRKWKLLFLILLIVSTVAQGYSVYTSETVVNERIAWCYVVHPLDYIADDCWNLTDPDQYILEAIQNPDEWTLPFEYRDSTFWFSAPWDDCWVTDPETGKLYLPAITEERPKPFLYNGTCYNYDSTYAGTGVVVEVLSEPPEKYWNITNLDKRLLWGINNPGKLYLMLILGGDSPYAYPAPPRPFLYNGTYYNYTKDFYIDFWHPSHKSPIKPEQTATILVVVWVVVWVAVGSVYLVKNRKAKAEPSAGSQEE